LKDSGITGKMWDLLKENSRKMRIRVLHPSILADSEVNVLRGLPEGSRLSPILFAIFAADLIRDLQLQFPEITIPTASALTWMGTIFYVYDAVLIEGRKHGESGDPVGGQGAAPVDGEEECPGGNSRARWRSTVTEAGVGRRGGADGRRGIQLAQYGVWVWGVRLGGALRAGTTGAGS
jgi:hypothetical protein